MRWLFLTLTLIWGGCTSISPDPESVSSPKTVIKDIAYMGGGANDRCRVSHCTCRVVPVRHSSEVSEEVELSHRKSFYFSEDSSELASSENAKLRRFLQTISTVTGQTISLVGYTDGCGTYQHNRQLALDRITTVREQVVELGTIPTRDISIQVEASPDHDPTDRRVDVIFHTTNRLTTMIDKIQADVYLVDASGSMWEGWTGWNQVIGASFRPNSRVYVSKTSGCYNGQRLSSVSPGGGTEIWYSYWWILNEIGEDKTLAIISDFQSTYSLQAWERRLIDDRVRENNISVIAIRP